MSWRVRIDVLRGGLVERARLVGLKGLPPSERAREGALRVLSAWTLFAVAGFGVQKASEHWQAVTPAAKQGLPTVAFNALLATALVGSALVLLGVALSLPALLRLIRADGWARIRRPIIRAVLLSLLTLIATAGLITWAHTLPAAAGNGRGSAYTGVFVAWIVLLTGSLLAWAAAAAATARQLTLPASTLRLEVWLGAAVSATMAVMTTATALWWASLASAAPWFFNGQPVGTHASPLAANILAPTTLMLCATTLALTATIQSVKALNNLPAPPHTL
jgi:hypothetical protein